MRSFTWRFTIIFVLSTLIFSCSKDEAVSSVDEGELATISFGSLLNDLAGKSAQKQANEIPDCTDGIPAYVHVALSQDGAWAVGSDTQPLRVDLETNPADFDGDGVNNYFTKESTQLKLEPGTYALEYFTVFDASGNQLWIAPRQSGSLSGLVNNPLPMNISLGAGVKKYVSVDVLCFDNRIVNEYGYLFFDIVTNEAIEFCIFGNFCDTTGRHFVASYSVDIWKYSGNDQDPRGAVLYAGLTNTVGTNTAGDTFSDPLCVALPDNSGLDQYYFEITILDTDEYDAQGGIIRSGVISDEDVRAFFDGETNNEYYHFREGNCGVGDSPALFSDIHLQVIAEGMVSPVGVLDAPDESSRLYVIDQIGFVWVINEDGQRLSEPFLDVRNKLVDLNPQYDERGLLGMAFHPDYATNGRFFVYYTAPPRPGGPEPGASWNNLSRISEFRVLPSDPTRADMGSERVILEIDQPQSNHEGGTVAFGPDGYLYISIGDGGNKNDIGPGHVPDWYEVNEGGNGQDVEANLLGNILRIDVNGVMPYGIPSDNPFVGTTGLDEIYAYGFRNPYRFSFDMEGSNRLFVGDAGQNLWEEISVVEKGGNYGWNVKEATHCFNAANNEVVLPSCPEVDSFGNPLIDPVIEMKNHHNPLGGRALVIVGGFVYRGNEIPELKGQYIFGSFSRSHEAPTGEIFMSYPSGPGLWNFHELQMEGDQDNIGYFLKGFGQDRLGEIYVTVSSVMGPTGNTGRILKLVP